MIGEGGEPEYVIPQSKMSSAMERYSGGSRGDAVLSDGGGEGGVAVLEQAMPINITTGPVMQFEGQNYVTQEQFAAGVKEAAKQGETMTLRRLRNSPSSRRRLGM